MLVNLNVEKVVSFDDWSQFSENKDFIQTRIITTEINGEAYKITVYERDHKNDLFWIFRKSLKALFFTTITLGFCLFRKEGRNLWSSVYYANERIVVKEQIIQKVAQKGLQNLKTESEIEYKTTQPTAPEPIRIQSEKQKIVTEEYSPNLSFISSKHSTELEQPTHLIDKHINLVGHSVELPKEKDNALLIAQEELEKRIEISNETIEKIKLAMPNILDRKANEDFTIIAEGNVLVFQLPNEPQLVFKLGGNLDSRFDNMIKGKSVCIENQLDLLVIPHAKKFEVEIENEQFTLIAEEKLDVNAKESYQEILYEILSTQLDETLRQLAIFVIKTSFSDVNYRNIPLINSSLKTVPKIALFDLEEMNGSWIGLFGRGGFFGAKRLGVIGCTFSNRQMEIIFKVASENKIKDVWGSSVDLYKKEKIDDRLKEIEAGLKLKQY